MRNCVFCHARYAAGQPCCTPTVLWDSSDGAVAAVLITQADGKQVKRYVALASLGRDWRSERVSGPFRGKWPVCGQWRHHRWLGEKCARCGATRKLRAA